MVKSLFGWIGTVALSFVCASNSYSAPLFELKEHLDLELEKPLAQMNSFYYFSKESDVNFFQLFSPAEAQEIFKVSSDFTDHLYTKESRRRTHYSKMRSENGAVPNELDLEIPDEFSEIESIQLLKAAADLRRLVPKDSTLLFPGRSPIWIKKAFDFLNQKRGSSDHIVEFNFSGYPGDSKMIEKGWIAIFVNLVTQSRYEHFKNYLLQKGLDLRRSGPLVVVDYFEAGDNLAGLIKILQKIYEDEGVKLPEIQVIDIAGPTISSAGIPPKQVQKTEHGDFFSFRAANMNPVSYRSLNLTNRTLVSFMIDFDHDSFSLGYYYPAYRWTQEYDQERDTRIFKNANRMYEGLKTRWESYWTETAFQYLNAEHVFHTVQDIAGLIELQTKVLNAQGEEALFVVDIDGVLTRFSNPQDQKGAAYSSIKGVPYEEKPGAISWLKSLFAEGFQVVLATAEPAYTETVVKLEDLKLSELLALKPPVGPIPFSYGKQALLSVRFGEKVASIGTPSKGGYYEKAFVPLALMSSQARSKVRQIILVEDNQSIIELFSAQMSVLGKEFPNLQEIHLVHMKPTYRN